MDEQREATTGQVKTEIGIEGSVFGREGSAALLKQLQEQLSKEQEEPGEIVQRFFKAETDERSRRQPGKTLAWGDARNAITAACFNLELILSGQEPDRTADLKSLEQARKENREKQPFNQEQREVLAKLYPALRKNLFPELPDLQPAPNPSR